MRRTLVTTERCLREIVNSPLSIWFSIINRQDNIVISTISEDNTIEKDSIEQRLHNKQIKIIPQSNIVNALPYNPTYLDFLKDCLFLLEIPKKQADELSRDYGICCLSSESMEQPYITKEGWEVRTDDRDPNITKSWDFFYGGVNRNCTSAIIIDRFLFCREWNKDNGCPDDSIDDCKYNLKCIMENVIPFEILDNKFVLSIIFNQEGAIKCEQIDEKGNKVKDSNGHTIYHYYSFGELVKMIEDVKKEIYRPFVYDIEVFSVSKKCKVYNDTHDRYVITNFHITQAPHKLVTFTPDQKFLYRQTLLFNYIYSKGLRDKSSIPLATKESVLRSLKELFTDRKAPGEISYALNGVIMEYKDDMIKNRLIKEG